MFQAILAESNNPQKASFKLRTRKEFYQFVDYMTSTVKSWLPSAFFCIEEFKIKQQITSILVKNYIP